MNIRTKLATTFGAFAVMVFAVAAFSLNSLADAN